MFEIELGSSNPLNIFFDSEGWLVVASKSLETTLSPASTFPFWFDFVVGCKLCLYLEFGFRTKQSTLKQTET